MAMPKSATNIMTSGGSLPSSRMGIDSASSAMTPATMALLEKRRSTGAKIMRPMTCMMPMAPLANAALLGWMRRLISSGMKWMRTAYMLKVESAKAKVSTQK